MKKSRSWFAPAVTIGSALVTLYAIETALSVAPPGIVDRIGVTLRKGPSVIAETWRLRQRGIKAYPYLQSDNFSLNGRGGLPLGDGSVATPLSGIPNVLTVLCNESGTTVGYRSDSLGFRNPPGIWSSHPEAVIIGDSFAHGFCRTESETITGQLRDQGLRAANAGFTGAGPLAELGALREYAAPRRPRHVFWLFYEGNDLIDLESERTTTLIKYLQRGFSQHLSDKTKLLATAELQYADSLVDAYAPPGKWFAIRGFLTMRNLRTASGLYRGASTRGLRDETRDLALLKQALAVASDEVRAWGGEIFLVYLPERRRFNSRLIPTVGENHDPLATEQAVSRMCNELGIPMLNAANEFAKAKNPAKLWNARRYHYNADGYRIVSDLIARSLTPRRVLEQKRSRRTELIVVPARVQSIHE